MKPNYLNHATAPRGKGYKFTQESLTVPGQVLDLRTIRDRYSRGQSVVSYAGEYDSPLPPGYENMDKIQKLEYARQVKTNVEEIRRAVEEKERLATEKRRQDDISAEVAKKIAESAEKNETSA